MRDMVRKKKAALSSVPASISLENRDNVGLIKIHENVIAFIVRKATCGVDGVLRLAGSPLIDNIAEIVGSRKIFDRSIVVDMQEGGVISVEIRINLAFGVHVPTVAANVQTAVAEEVRRLTGMQIAGVNVVVQEMDEHEDED